MSLPYVSATNSFVIDFRDGYHISALAELLDTSSDSLSVLVRGITYFTA